MRVPRVLGSIFFRILKKHERQDSVANTDGNDQILNTMSVLEISTSNVCSRSLSFLKVAKQTPIQIPARSMKAVLCTTRQDSKTKYSALVQAVQGDHSTLTRNIMVIDNYADLECGNTPVRVVNIGDDDVWLNPKSRIGILHEADVKYASDPNCQMDFKVISQEIQAHIEKIQSEMQGETKYSGVVTTKASVKIHGTDVDIGQIFNKEQKQRLVSVLEKHQDVFSKNADDLGFTDTTQHKIFTTDDVPVKLPHRRIPPNQIVEVKLHIKNCYSKE